MRGAALLAVLLLPACAPEEAEPLPEPVSSRSYQGHTTEADGDTLVAAYPFLVGTRLDDCQTCHAGVMEADRLIGSSCDHCHALLVHKGGGSPGETLNPFGLAYLEAGRSTESLRTIEEGDADGDGYANGAELTAGRYPGSPRSQPGQETATLLTLTVQELRALPLHRQFLLVNNTQQRFDDYLTYGGVRVMDLLESQSVDLSGASGITVIAPDGYRKSIPVEQVTGPAPPGVFHRGLGVESLGSECGFVNYPDALPEGISDGGTIPGEPWLILAWEREGGALDPAILDHRDGRISGEGPLRLVVPQVAPGTPDRGSRFSPSGCGDGFDFREHADHNAGSMVRGVVAIRIDPMPMGLEEFDYMNGGWALVDAGELILYGHGIR